MASSHQDLSERGLMAPWSQASACLAGARQQRTPAASKRPLRPARLRQSNRLVWIIARLGQAQPASGGTACSSGHGQHLQGRRGAMPADWQEVMVPPVMALRREHRCTSRWAQCPGRDGEHRAAKGRAMASSRIAPMTCAVGPRRFRPQKICRQRPAMPPRAITVEAGSYPGGAGQPLRRCFYLPRRLRPLLETPRWSGHHPRR